MKYQKVIKYIKSLGAALIITGCASPPPYVHLGGEFNRDSQSFRQTIVDRSEVEICYAKDGTTPAEITAMAQKECARYSKRAVFREQSLQVCPLLTPIAAVYDCVESASVHDPYKTFN